MTSGAGTACGSAHRIQRVFLSHTTELRQFPSPVSFVAAAESAVTRARLSVSDHAYLTLGDRKPADSCQLAVREADIYVGIIGFRYGSLTRDAGPSYTELEFDTATALRLPRLVVLLDEHGVIPLPAELIIDSVHGARQAAFRRRLREESSLTVGRVTTPWELETVVYQALVAVAHPFRSATPARSRGGHPVRPLLRR